MPRHVARVRLTHGVALLALIAAVGGGAHQPESGAQLWVGRYVPGDFAYSLAASPDGSRVYVTGDAGHMGTVAYNAVTGAQFWAATYDSGGAFDTASAVAASPDGARVFVTGQSPGVGTNYTDYTTVAYDSSTGDQLWAATYDGPGDRTDESSGLVVTPDSSLVIVTGDSQDSQLAFDYATVAYNAATGDQVWVSRYTGIGLNGGTPHGIEMNPTGHVVYVTGESQGNLRNDYATVAYDTSSGEQLWVARYNSGGTRGDTAYALAVSPDGSGVFVTGCTGIIDYCSEGDIVTIGYDAATGTPLWLKRFAGPGHGLDKGSAIGVSPDSSTVYVGGTSLGFTGNDFAIVAYDASTGAQVWRGVYNGPGNSSDTLTAIAVSPDGSKVFVTGESSLNYDQANYATVGFDAANGKKAWFRLYDGPSHVHDDAKAIGVSPDGSRVFVTGESIGPDWDYATVAYAA